MRLFLESENSETEHTTAESESKKPLETLNAVLKTKEGESVHNMQQVNQVLCSLDGSVLRSQIDDEHKV